MVTRGNAPPESAVPRVSQGVAVCSLEPLYLVGCHCAIIGLGLELQDTGCLETSVNLVVEVSGVGSYSCEHCIRQHQTATGGFSSNQPLFWLAISMGIIHILFPSLSFPT